MATKKINARKKSSAPKASAIYQASTVRVAAHNLLNMAAVAAASATILLCLLVIKKF